MNHDSKRALTLVLVAVLGGLALAVFALSLWLRSGLRDQVLRREGESLLAVTTLQRELERERLADLELSSREQELALVALQTSRLEGVLGMQVFGADGRELTEPMSSLPIAAPSAEEWNRLRNLAPIVRLATRPAKNTAGSVVVLDIIVPLQGMEPSVAPTSAARYVLDGRDTAAEFARIDRQLALQAFIVWLIAGTLLTSVSLAAWSRLQRANDALQRRTAELMQANRELTFAAKTSALGAVTAHLVHGLRNPIAGIEQLIAGAERGEAAGEGIAAARRMRDMVNEVVTLMREEDSGVAYEVSAEELLQEVQRRVSSLAQARGVSVQIARETDVTALTNREFSLSAAILTNLARNACEAVASQSGVVEICAGQHAGQRKFSVRDNGPGIAAEVAAGLFEPVQSTKSGGAGIGLAISRQMAAHLGAKLSHSPRVDRSGAEFSLILPSAP